MAPPVRTRIHRPRVPRHALTCPSGLRGFGGVGETLRQSCVPDRRRRVEPEPAQPVLAGSAITPGQRRWIKPHPKFGTAIDVLADRLPPCAHCTWGAAHWGRWAPFGSDKGGESGRREGDPGPEAQDEGSRG